MQTSQNKAQSLRGMHMMYPIQQCLQESQHGRLLTCPKLTGNSISDHVRGHVLNSLQLKTREKVIRSDFLPNASFVLVIFKFRNWGSWSDTFNSMPSFRWDWALNSSETL